MSDDTNSVKNQPVQSACAFTYFMSLDEMGGGNTEVSDFLRMELLKLARAVESKFPDREVRCDYVPLIVGNSHTEQLG